MLVLDMLCLWERLASAFVFLYPCTLKPIVFIAKATKMWIKFLLYIQLYQDQNIAASSFATVDKYQHCLQITSTTIKFSISISCFDILFLLRTYRENNQH